MRAHTPRSIATLPRCLLACCLFFLVQSQAFAAPPSPRMIAFGDSLSDTGNAAVLLDSLAEPPYSPEYPGPYAVSDGRFSDGKIWLEVLAKRIDAKKGAKASLTNPGRHTNYAVGGARAHSVGRASLSEQVSTFLSDFDGVAPRDALYVLWFGGNDLRDAVEVIADSGFDLQTQDPVVVQATVERAVGWILESAIIEISKALGSLQRAGANRVLVVHAPDIAYLPALQQRFKPVVLQLVSQLTDTFNESLSAALNAFKMDPKLDIVQFDVNGLLDRVFERPQGFGLANFATPCLSFNPLAAPVCDRPTDYFFWDQLHPTRAAHRLIGNAVADCLAAGPQSNACAGLVLVSDMQGQGHGDSHGHGRRAGHARGER